MRIVSWTIESLTRIKITILNSKNKFKKMKKLIIIIKNNNNNKD